MSVPVIFDLCEPNADVRTGTSSDPNPRPPSPRKMIGRMYASAILLTRTVSTQGCAA